MDIRHAIEQGADNAPAFFYLNGVSQSIVLCAMSEFLNPKLWTDVTDYDEAQAALSKAIEEAMTPVNIDAAPPIGSIMPYAGITGDYLQDGWLICNGQWLLKADYPELFTVIGGWYGENSTEFRLPQIGGRVIEAVQSPDTAGTMKGADSVTLAMSNIPQHNHSITTYSTIATFVGSGAATRSVITGSSSGSTGNAGSATPESIPLRQPTIALKYVIRYK